MRCIFPACLFLFVLLGTSARGQSSCKQDLLKAYGDLFHQVNTVSGESTVSFRHTVTYYSKELPEPKTDKIQIIRNSQKLYYKADEVEAYQDSSHLLSIIKKQKAAYFSSTGSKGRPDAGLESLAIFEAIIKEAEVKSCLAQANGEVLTVLRPAEGFGVAEVSYTLTKNKTLKSVAVLYPEGSRYSKIVFVVVQLENLRGEEPFTGTVKELSAKYKSSGSGFNFLQLN